MGSSVSKDFESIACIGDLKKLDLSKTLTPNDYMKHLDGEVLEGCLQEIPLDIVYYDIISLYEEVIFSFNCITYVPEEFSLKVPHLRMLNISHNHLSSLPNSFHLLLHLRQLDLSYNKFDNFPETICKLQKLKQLNISHNNLKDVPHSISQLEHLSKLNVSQNNLRALPEELLDCKNLDVLVTFNNQLIHPPQAVCDQGTQFVLDHLSKSRLSTGVERSNSSNNSVVFNVFHRIRGHQVLASVSNPESASREYKQAQGTSRTNKRKCPLMVPASATSLAPDQLKNSILGLVYGSCIGDALALNTEGLSNDECLFFYSSKNFTLSSRIRDWLRSNFPPSDWSSNIDIMLLTLDSLMRWGGVVDELEMVSQLRQWKVHGHTEVDPFPGFLLSPLMSKVTETENYAVNPHSASDCVYKTTKDNQMRGLDFDTNTQDNSCLPAAVVLGIPNFHKENEVAMNAERICKASHGSPVAKAASIFVALLAAYLLQGKLRSSEASRRVILEGIKIKCLENFDPETEKELMKGLNLEHPYHGSPDDALLTIRHVLEILTNNPEEGNFKESLMKIVLQGGKGACAHACVAGGVLGAFYGYSQIPQDWLSQLPHNNQLWLGNKLNLLLDLFGLP